MIKREIVETVYEYADNGTLLKKAVTKTLEEDDNTYQSNWSNVPLITCNNN
jgi:hypothetical protein